MRQASGVSPSTIQRAVDPSHAMPLEVTPLFEASPAAATSSPSRRGRRPTLVNCATETVLGAREDPRPHPHGPGPTARVLGPRRERMAAARARPPINYNSRGSLYGLEALSPLTKSEHRHGQAPPIVTPRCGHPRGFRDHRPSPARRPVGPRDLAACE